MLRLLIVGALVLNIQFWVLSPSCYAQDALPVSQETLTLIAESNRRHRTSMDSLAYEYEWIYAFPPENGEREEVIKSGKYAVSGQNEFNFETFSDGLTRHYVRNGDRGVLRTGDNLVNISESDNTVVRIGLPTAWDTFDEGLSLVLDDLPAEQGRVLATSRIHEGEAEYVLVQLQKEISSNDPVMPEKIQLAYQIWYSVEHDLMPVKIEIIGDVPGHPAAKTGREITKVERYDVGDKYYFLPIEQDTYMSVDGEIMQTTHFWVDPESVQYDVELPDELFKIDIQVSDQVVLSDFDMTVDQVVMQDSGELRTEMPEDVRPEVSVANSEASTQNRGEIVSVTSLQPGEGRGWASLIVWVTGFVLLLVAGIIWISSRKKNRASSQ